MSLPLLFNIGSADTQIEVGSPITDAPRGGVLTIENEIITFQSADSSRFYGCTRGVQGTTAVSHLKDKGVTFRVNPSPTVPVSGEGVLIFKNVSADLGSVGAATPATTIFTPVTSGIYLLSFYGITTVNGSETAPNLYLAWTDEGGIQKYFYYAGNLDPVHSDGANQVTIPVYAVAGQPIWMATSAGGYVTTRWNFYFHVTKA